MFSKELNFEEVRQLENHLMVDVFLALSWDATRVMESGPKIVHTAYTNSLHPLLMGRNEMTWVGFGE